MPRQTATGMALQGRPGANGVTRALDVVSGSLTPAGAYSGEQAWSTRTHALYVWDGRGWWPQAGGAGYGGQTFRYRAAMASNVPTFDGNNSNWGTGQSGNTVGPSTSPATMLDRCAQAPFATGAVVNSGVAWGSSSPAVMLPRAVYSRTRLRFGVRVRSAAMALKFGFARATFGSPDATPSNDTQWVGFGCDGVDTNLKFYGRSDGAPVTTDLGAAWAKSFAGLYLLEWWYADPSVTMRLTRVDDGQSTEQTYAGASATGTALYPCLGINAGALATAVGLGVVDATLDLAGT